MVAYQGSMDIRDHAATEVYVTGTFDDWAKSVKLDKKDGSRFEKLVELPQVEENVYYKVGVGVCYSSCIGLEVAREAA